MHGYSRSFTIWFAAIELDSHGFVVDFSRLTNLETKLKHHFDHTFLVNHDDPFLKDWERLHAKGVIDLRVMENVGMEFTAKLVWEWANKFLLDRYGGRACCWRVDARENSKNSASFEKTPKWYEVK